MLNQKVVDLQKEYGLQGGSLECICIDVYNNGKRPAVVVAPGGGYAHCSEREATNVALAFVARGFQAFVLRYKTVTDGVSYPEQLLELSASLDYVRKNAEAFFVNPDEVFAVGFSAGGHLVADLANEYMLVEEKYGKPLDCKPTAVGLSYPVIYQQGHVGSFTNLLKNLPEEEQARLLPTLNLDERVTKDTPPAFIWSTYEDQLVSCENALRYAMAMKKAGVQFALHIYPFGRHGISLADYEVSAAFDERALEEDRGWVDECAKFFRIYVSEKY